MNVIKRILEKVACCHEWEILTSCDKYESSSSQRPYKTTILFYCHKCGKMKKVVIDWVIITNDTLTLMLDLHELVPIATLFFAIGGGALFMLIMLIVMDIIELFEKRNN